MKKLQTGFTLIELAIVLVIIGLLLGGVLKGQELINSAKVKNLANDFRSVPIYIYGYQDKFKSIPGDDANVVAHLGATATVGTGGTLGNGVIQGAWDAIGNEESAVFWQHVRLAGLAPGGTTVGTTNGYFPTNAEGGRVGIASLANAGIPTSPTAMNGSYVVCSRGILGKFAKQLDTTLDDGETSTGSLRAYTAAATTYVTSNVSSPTIVDSNSYDVCLSL